jgi:hypothetical protein
MKERKALIRKRVNSISDHQQFVYTLIYGDRLADSYTKHHQSLGSAVQQTYKT